MRVLTPLVKTGLILDAAVMSEGQLLFGKGTRLSRRYLRAIHEEGIRMLDIVDDPRIDSWERVPEVDEFVNRLDERFAGSEKNRRMRILKKAVKDVYLDFLFDLESTP